MTAGMLLGDLKNTSRKEGTSSGVVKSIAASAVLGSRVGTYPLQDLDTVQSASAVRTPLFGLHCTRPTSVL